MRRTGSDAASGPDDIVHWSLKMHAILPRSLAMVLALILCVAGAGRLASAADAAYSWKPLRVGAGGFVTGIDASADGTVRVVRTDTYGAYVWDAELGRWRQTVTASSMPPADVGADKGGGVYEIRVAPSLPNRLYMAYRGSLYRSDTTGMRWTRTTLPQVTKMTANDDFRTFGAKMAVDPANPDVVYVGTPDSGLFVTVDGGVSWQRVTAVAAAMQAKGAWPGFAGIAFDGRSGTTAGRTNTIYASSYGNGVWQTTNGGASWAQIAGGPHGGPRTVRHAAIATDSVYYVTSNEPHGGRPNGVWRYARGTWQEIGPGGQYWASVATDPFDARRVVIGSNGGQINVSRSGGDGWDGPITAVRRHADDIPWLAWTYESFMSNGDMVFDPVVPDRLWFAQGIGVWQTALSRAKPSAITWVSQNTGIEQLVANAIAVPPGGKPVLASWDRPLFHSADQDAFPSRHGPNNARPIVMGWALDYATTDPRFMVALTNWWGVEQTCYSLDGGQTWTVFPSFPPWPTMPIGGSIAASTPDNIVWVPSNKQAPYVTANRGASWRKLALPGVSDDQTANGWGGLHWAYYLNRHVVAADRVNAGTFYLYHFGHGLFRSTDGGNVWTLVHIGELAPWSGVNAKLRTVPGHAGHLFFTSGPQSGTPKPSKSGHFKRSIDGGSTWTVVPNVLEVHAFGFGKVSAGAAYPTIYIAGWVQGVYGIWRSDDDARSWVRIADYPLGSLDGVKAVEGDKDVFGKVYIGFSGSGYAYGVPLPATERR
jgi:hypothetical protein